MSYHIDQGLSYTCMAAMPHHDTYMCIMALRPSCMQGIVAHRLIYLWKVPMTPGLSCMFDTIAHGLAHELSYVWHHTTLTWPIGYHACKHMVPWPMDYWYVYSQCTQIQLSSFSSSVSLKPVLTTDMIFYLQTKGSDWLVKIYVLVRYFWVLLWNATSHARIDCKDKKH